MVLPSGPNPLSFSDIRVELSGSAGVLTSLWVAENNGYATVNQCSVFRPTGTQPATMSEWYQYNHGAVASVYLTNTEGPSGTSAGACDLADADARTIYVVSAVYYATSNCSTLIQNGYHRNSSKTTWYQFTDGAQVSSGACTTTTTTTTTTAPACGCNKASECTSDCFCVAGSPCSSPDDCNGTNPCQ